MFISVSADKKIDCNSRLIVPVFAKLYCTYYSITIVLYPGRSYDFGDLGGAKHNFLEFLGQNLHEKHFLQ
jgi:hypothetical protein